MPEGGADCPARNDPRRHRRCREHDLVGLRGANLHGLVHASWGAHMRRNSLRSLRPTTGASRAASLRR
ncbi:MAG: hypothetical protein MZV70_41705 [Desulfobacterales bacterium]|nr:hypothetical protein [Desulfobacterales bacterium]